MNMKQIEKYLLVAIQILFCFLLLTPLIISKNFFFPFVAPKSLYFFAVSELIIFVYLILAISFPRYRPRFNVLLVTLFLFLVVSILSTIFGVCPAKSFWSKYERMTGLLMWLHLFGLFVAGSSVFKKEDWIKIFGVSVIIAVIVGSLAIISNKGVGPLVKAKLETRGGGTLGNSSFLASYLLFNAFLALYLFLIFVQKQLKIFFGIIFAVVALCLLFSTGRAATLSFIGGVILLFLLWCSYCQDKKLKIAGTFLLVILSVGLVLVIYSSLLYSYFGQEDAIYKAILERFSLNISKDRTLVWSIGIRAWEERPYLGWGPENFDIAFTKYFDPRLFIREVYGMDVWFDRAHNVIVETLLSVGVVGLVIYILFFLSIFWVLWKKYHRQELDFLTTALFSVTLLAYFMQNLTVFDMVSSYMMFFVVLGFVGSIAVTREKLSLVQEKFLPFRFWISFLVLLLVCGLSLFYFVIQPVRSNMTFIKAVRQQDSEERFNLYEQSLKISSLGKLQMKENIASREMRRYTNQQIAQIIPQDTQKRELDFITQKLEENIKESPLLFSSYLLLGKTYNIYARIDSSKLQKASEVLNKAIEVSPGNQQGYWALAQTKMFQGKFDEAFTVAQKALLLAPEAKQSALVMVDVAAITAKFTGNLKTLKEAITIALGINSNWAKDIQLLLNQRGVGIPLSKD